MRLGFLAGLASLWACAAWCADKPVYGPPPAWVKPLPVPSANGAVGGGATQLLMQDTQIRFGPNGDEFYDESAVRIATPQGLSEIGNIGQSWNPDTETLFIHKVRVLRGDKTIDLLAGGATFTVLRRETKLELAMLDGSLTAAFQPEGLQVGDVLDVAFTLVRRDPLWKGRSEGFSDMAQTGKIPRYHLSALWAPDKPMRYKAGQGLGTPAVGRDSAGVNLVIDRTDVEAPKPPIGAPSRFSHENRISFSQFQDWSEVAALMAPLYDKAATLTSSSPLQAEIARISAASPDPRVRAERALELVQSQTRYLFLGMDLGGYLPADADLTWKRRFGDCKGKTVLLLALLRGLGIEAEPVLVSTTLGDGMSAELPRLRVFDHVLVRARIAGKTYWLDGTRQGDHVIDDIPAPPFRWALPLQASGSNLVEIAQPPFSEPHGLSETRIDLSGGVDAPAPIHMEILFRGDSGLGTHFALANIPAEDLDRRLREVFSKNLPWVTISHVEAPWDDKTNTLTLIMDGSAAVPWSRFTGGRQFHLKGSQLGGEVSFTRQPGLDQDAPFAVAYPSYSQEKVTVVLPNKGLGFRLGGGADVDQTIAGVTYHRRSTLQDGVVSLETSQRAVEREFPAAEAPAAALALRTLGLTDVWISFVEPSMTTAPGQDGRSSPPPLFIKPVQPNPSAMSTPTDAQGFLKRGAAWLVAHDNDRALADFNEAVKLDPKSAAPLFARAAAYVLKPDIALARIDLDKALAISPDDAQGLQLRGALRLRVNDDAGARADFDRAIRVKSGAEMPFRAAISLATAHRYALSMGYFDQAIAAASTDPHLYLILTGRCATRAMWGQGLDDGLDDCRLALILKPTYAEALADKALIELRQGALDAARADYDAALRAKPDLAGALYGRSIVESRKGLRSEAETDRAAAVKLTPKIVAEYAGYGVSP